MINVSNIKGSCTGCAACAVVCPKKAISMEKDSEGFFSAVIDKNSCVSCGICTKVCNKGQPFEKTPFLETLAAQTKSKDILLSSSSGGVAATLSLLHAAEGGYVLGAFFDAKKNLVDTLASRDVGEVARFQKSKYLQSNFYAGLSEAIKIAREDPSASFLVFGTPCQINGAANACEYFGVKKRFAFVDFFCHGVPSYLVWSQYLKDLGVDESSIKDVSFRTKKFGWQSCFAIQVSDENKTYFSPSGKDPFYNCFFDNVFLMKACYSCRFRKGYSKSDLRLGDYWGRRYSDNAEGVSSVLVFSEKGRELIRKGAFNVLPSGDDLFAAQSTADYPEIAYRSASFSLLASKKSLGATIKRYRKAFPLRRRMKLFAKRIIFSLVSPKRIAKIKRIKWKKK